MISVPDITTALRQTALFKDLNDEALTKIAAKAKVRQFFPDETIVWQGKLSDSLFLITSGIVAVKKVIGQDREHIFAYLMAGQTFGEVGILDNQMRSATVSTLSEVDVLVIRRQDFFEILHRYPVVAIELARLLGRYLLDANRRQSRGDRTTKVILVLGVEREAGTTSVGIALCKALKAAQEILDHAAK